MIFRSLKQKYNFLKRLVFIFFFFLTWNVLKIVGKQDVLLCIIASNYCFFSGIFVGMEMGTLFFCLNVHQHILNLYFGLFNDISIFMGFLMPTPSL